MNRNSKQFGGIMGQRRLLVTPRYLVEMLREHRGEPRYITVADALPDDTVLVRTEHTASDRLSLILESSSWDDDPAWSGALLVQPSVTIHFPDDDYLVRGGY